jgi:hypothetical protein
MTTLAFICQQCGWIGDVPAIVGANAPPRTSPLLAAGQGVCGNCGTAFRGVVTRDSDAWEKRTLNAQKPMPTYPTAARG